MTTYVDSHAHLHLCNDSPHALIERAKAASVIKIINVATDLESSQNNLILAAQYPEVLPTAGIHPSELKNLDQIAELDRLLQRHSFSAIGEIGIDYYHKDNPPRDLQMAGFRAQLELAKRHNMPVIIHTRHAAEDTLVVASEFPELTKVFHCFSETPEFIQRIASPTTYFSFTGMITYANKSAILESVAAVDIHHIMIETDCPYLTPTTHGKIPNEPAFVVDVAQKIAETKSLSLDEVAHHTTQNVHTFFRF